MVKRYWFLRRRRLWLTLIPTITTFLICVISPWHKSFEQVNDVLATEQAQVQKVDYVQKEKEASSDFKLGNTGIFNAQSNQALKNVISELEKQVKQQRLTFAAPKHLQGKTLKDIKISSKNKAIALTFDDGPVPEWTPQILDILKKNNIKATFFMLGRNLQNNPELGKKVVAEGHAVANHTWHHWYHKMDAVTAAKEIDDTTALIYKVTGVKTSIFRPPGGFLNNGVVDYAKKKNYFIAMWSADSIDYNRPAVDKLVKNVLINARPGGMVLMHDAGGDRSSTVKALPIIINNLKKQGYQFVTVPELLEMEENQPGTGAIAKKHGTLDMIKQQVKTR